MLVLVVNYSPLAILQCAEIPQISLPINLAARGRRGFNGCVNKPQALNNSSISRFIIKDFGVGINSPKLAYYCLPPSRELVSAL